MIDEATILKVKESADIVDVLSDFCDLRRDGVGYTCLCPFHDDRHIGSFKISKRRNIYTCFSCGAQGGPVDFLMNHEHYSFADAIRWLGKKYSIEVEGNDRFKPKPCAPRKPLPQLPLLVLDKEKYMRPTLLKDNNLTNWLHTLPWDDAQRTRLDIMLKNYFVGTSKQGHAIFWQVDDKGRCRTGKMMTYETNGKRKKDPKTGKGIGSNYIHSVLEKAGLIDLDKADYEQCLYGLHLVDFAKPMTVNIVESEKTAIIAATAWGNMQGHLWLALGGKHNLKREKLQPLIDRNINIVLYPDKDAIEDWKAMAKAVGYKHLIVNEDFMRTYWKPEDGDKADIADIILRMITPKIEKMLEAVPEARHLVEKFDLELISINKNEREE